MLVRTGGWVYSPSSECSHITCEILLPQHAPMLAFSGFRHSTGGVYILHLYKSTRQRSTLMQLTLTHVLLNNESHMAHEPSITAAVNVVLERGGVE